MFRSCFFEFGACRGEDQLLGPQSMPAQPGNPFGAIHGGALLDSLATLGRNPAVIAVMVCTGAIGLILIAIGGPVTCTLGAVLAFSAGWGWTGLLLATTLRLVPGRAEQAGHTVQVRVYAGATIAPFAFGAVSSAVGFAGATLLAAVAALAAAASMAAGTRTMNHNAQGFGAAGSRVRANDDPKRVGTDPTGPAPRRPATTRAGSRTRSHGRSR